MIKEKLTDLIKAGFKEKHNLNCAETILYGANQIYELGLDQKDLRVAAGFGGGMGIEDVCGALTGVVMVLGLLFVEEKGHESQIKDYTGQLFKRYQEKMGNIKCAPLKDKYRTEAEGCKEVILVAAEILEDIIAENRE